MFSPLYWIKLATVHVIILFCCKMNNGAYTLCYLDRGGLTPYFGHAGNYLSYSPSPDPYGVSRGDSLGRFSDGTAFANNTSQYSYPIFDASSSGRSMITSMFCSRTCPFRNSYASPPKSDTGNYRIIATREKQKFFK